MDKISLPNKATVDSVIAAIIDLYKDYSRRRVSPSVYNYIGSGGESGGISPN